MSFQNPDGENSEDGYPKRPSEPPRSAGGQSSDSEQASDHQPTEPIAASPQPQQSAQYSQSSQAAQPPKPQKGGQKRFGIAMLIACTLIAGLIGGGAAAGVTAAITAEESGGDVEEQSGSAAGDAGIDVNREEDATAVTQAAAQASPSVVTLSVTAGQSGGSGSGVILDDEGHILTNTHVVTLGGAVSEPSINVQTGDGSVYSAEVVGTDPESDLAVVKVDAENLQPIEMGSSSDLNVGDQTIAIGSPLGLAGTVTDGIVSQMNRTITVASSAAPESDEGEGDSGGSEFEFRFPGMEQQSSQGQIYLNVIQSDAAINRGNSGGALVDDQGRLIGVNVAIASAGSGSSGQSGNIGVGFAIPVDYAERIANELIENGDATHGMLGVQVTPEPAEAQGGESESVADSLSGEAARSTFSAGARIQEVVGGSPADEAGLQEGDLITGVDDRPIADATSLTATVRQFPAEGSGEVHFVRDGEEQSVEVTFASNAEQ